MANYHVTKDKESGDWKAKREGYKSAILQGPSVREKGRAGD